MSCGVSQRRVFDLMLLWQWGKPAAVALIGPLAWEPPRALGAALKNKIKKKKEKDFFFSMEFYSTYISIAALTDI